VIPSRTYRGRHSKNKPTDSELIVRVFREARCACSPVDPDEWFPISPDVARARTEAARAIAVCTTCPVRADCLEFSLRHAFDAGAYGVWGGLVERERRTLRRRWLAGASVSELI
jgi:WhiB family redox-sensing transcriptional regulator